MKNIDERKSRYMRDPLPVRMGGLAANLARVGSFSVHEGGKVAVLGLLEESKYFIEWIAAEYDAWTAAELVDIQRQLAKWQGNIDSIWTDVVKRKAIGDEAKKISNRLLSKSGLLNQ